MIVAYELILLTKSRKRFLYSECCTVQGLYFQFVYFHLNIALRVKKNNNNNKKKTRRPSSVIFLDKDDRRVLSIEQVGNVCPKIKLPSEKTPFLRVFRATKTRSKRGGPKRATGRSPRLLRAWIRSPERNRKKRQRLFCRLISQTNLRGRCR